MFVAFLTQIPLSSREVVEPKMMEDFAGSSGESIFDNYLFKPFYNTAYYMPLIIGPVILVLPVVISLLLPRYTAGILPTQIVALGCYFLGLVFVTRGVVVAYKWQVKASLLMVGILLVNVLLSSGLAVAGYGIVGVAFGSTVSYCLLFISLLVFIRRQGVITYTGWWKNIIGVCWPFLFMCFLLLILQTFSNFLPFNIYLQALIQVTVYSVFIVILIIAAQRRYPFLTKIRLKKS